MTIRRTTTLLMSGLVATLVGSTGAHAAGWDTPILYSAQHMGMGGAAIAYVDDPSAMFHNPAGLGRTEGLTLMANLSVIFGTITSSPEGVDSARDIESENILSTPPLVGVSWKAADIFAAGLGFYPVAAAGATYKYNDGAKDIENTTEVRFYELTPAIAFSFFDKKLTIGVDWRITIATLDRVLTKDVGVFDLAMSGTNLAGFRFGVQYQPIPELQLGAVFRTKTVTTLEDSAGLVFSQEPERDAKIDFTLPAKLGLGARTNLDPIAIVLDFEYAFQSQNQVSIIETDPPIAGITVNNVFKWDDGITLRAGLEYELKDPEFDSSWFFRGGFIYDGQVTKEQYPSAFGTPPGPTTSVTAGVGYRCGQTWAMNFAVAHRMGTAKVRQSVIDEQDLADGADKCLACSEGGNYKISLTGIYLDFKYSFL
ncbi:MAG: outer membrane protein transport protein [Myxococcales bacterium]|nr:outer membrane protein transport protein [Myxococcales bacterium]MCB9733759.1 outer membrane protein transport protein [Deltaproteobacteria bacterium]